MNPVSETGTLTQNWSLLQGIKLLGDCEYVAIFDADFKPEPDFLLRTVPYLIGNSEIGYVQTRWTFTNPEESYLTKVTTHQRCRASDALLARAFVRSGHSNVAVHDCCSLQRLARPKRRIVP